MRSELAQLLVPAIRWDPERGFEASRSAIAHALDLGVGGFILFGGDQEAVRALTKELRGKSRQPLLIVERVHGVRIEAKRLVLEATQTLA